MVRSVSPLRYPGGKACLYEMLCHFLRHNHLTGCQYVEPFAGGAGLALSLLFQGEVAEIHINDLDPAIYAFWYSVVNHTQDFIELIDSVNVNMDEWYRQKELLNSDDILEKAFSVFFLNRTNRSGIIQGAGVIGGKEQKGKYKINCRFNKEELCSRIKRISRYKDRIHITNEDAVKFLTKKNSNDADDMFFCIDPPYFKKGASLYTNYYKEADHAFLADVVLKIRNPWVVTYDCVPEIQNLYQQKRQFMFGINYSAQTKRVGKEILIASDGLNIPFYMKKNSL